MNLYYHVLVDCGNNSGATSGCVHCTIDIVIILENMCTGCLRTVITEDQRSFSGSKLLINSPHRICELANFAVCLRPTHIFCMESAIYTVIDSDLRLFTETDLEAHILFG